MCLICANSFTAVLFAVLLANVGTSYKTVRPHWSMTT